MDILFAVTRVVETVHTTYSINWPLTIAGTSVLIFLSYMINKLRK